MSKRLLREFYIQPTLRAAKQMLGKYLVHKIGNKKLIGKIVETEAYIGPEDKASHAFGGKMTERNKAEYLIGGHIYIYLVYGMYWQLNISTGKEGLPECVLIRALEPLYPKSHTLDPNIANGPGKLCRWMRFNKSFYGEDLVKSNRVWLEDRGERIKPNQIIASKRVGIDYAQEWAERPWRFHIKNNKFVSKT